jgi:hypothetical protein
MKTALFIRNRKNIPHFRQCSQSMEVILERARFTPTIGGRLRWENPISTVDLWPVSWNSYSRLLRNPRMSGLVISRGGLVPIDPYGTRAQRHARESLDYICVEVVGSPEGMKLCLRHLLTPSRGFSVPSRAMDSQRVNRSA